MVNVVNALTYLVISFQCLVAYDHADEWFLIFSLSIVMISYALHYGTSKKAKSQLKDDVFTFVFLMGIIAFLTPLLQSLTQTVSHDTITACCVFFIFIHCLAYDY